jgi:hypothetical protein
MKKIVSILSFALLLNASVTTTDSLTLDEALNLLKSNNLEIKAAKFDVEGAKEDVDAVWGKTGEN